MRCCRRWYISKYFILYDEQIYFNIWNKSNYISVSTQYKHSKKQSILIKSTYFELITKLVDINNNRINNILIKSYIIMTRFKVCSILEWLLHFVYISVSSRLPKTIVLHNKSLYLKIVNHTQLNVLYETNKTIRQVKYTIHKVTIFYKRTWCN